MCPTPTAQPETKRIPWSFPLTVHVAFGRGWVFYTYLLLACQRDPDAQLVLEPQYGACRAAGPLEHPLHTKKIKEVQCHRSAKLALATVAVAGSLPDLSCERICRPAQYKNCFGCDEIYLGRFVCTCAFQSYSILHCLIALHPPQAIEFSGCLPYLKRSLPSTNPRQKLPPCSDLHRCHRKKNPAPCSQKFRPGGHDESTGM